MTQSFTHHNLVARLLLVLLTCCHTTMSAEPGATVNFNRDIQPILSKKCFACHGPSDQEAGLALHVRDLAIAEADSGSNAIVPGDAEQSELIQRITSAHEEEMMPPEGERLSSIEVELLKTWIEEGAVYDKHWSFVKPAAVELPTVQNTEAIINEVDHFVLARLEKENITPSETADKATLLRRLSLDLTGLLPSTTDLDLFLNDNSETAYEKLVDRLLASEHFGERWGRHWLDLARYADTFGYERDDVRPNAWRYRDWVVNSFNTNQPYNQFVVEQLAGDLLPNSTQAQKVATGLHRMNIKNMEAGINKEDYRNREMVDRLNTTGTAFLGLTLGCCQCHSHKYDPISQKEYYQLYDFFNNIKPVNLDVEGTPEENTRYQAALDEYNQRRELLLLRQKTLQTLSSQGTLQKWHQAVKNQNIELQYLADWLTAAINNSPENWIEGLTLKQAKTLDLPKTIHKALAVEPAKRTEEHRQNIIKEYKELPKHLERFKKNIRSPKERIASLFIEQETRTALLKPESKLNEKEQQLVTEFRASIPSRKDDTAKALRQQSVEKRHLPKPQIMVLEEIQKERRETFLLARGDFKQKTEKVFAATPAVLTPLTSRGDKPDRLDFAHWLVSEDHPLTARVAVNHIWKHLFGAGIVSTMDDFGTQGSPPSHPELLDWLAVQFRESGWDRKALIKRIVMSATYRQSSVYRPELEKVDPQNRLLARQSRFRVESEIVRDLYLDASDLLHPQLGGPTIHPQIPQAMRDQGYKYKTRWELSNKPDRYRRGMYIHFKRTNPYPSLIMFDNPEGNVCIAERTRSNTPLQSLVTLNDPVFVECAQALGFNLWTQEQKQNQPAIQAGLLSAGKKCFSRDFNDSELATLTSLFEEELQWYQAHEQEAQAFVGDYSTENKPVARLAAWVAVARAILNLDEFITRE